MNIKLLGIFAAILYVLTAGLSTIAVAQDSSNNSESNLNIVVEDQDGDADDDGDDDNEEENDDGDDDRDDDHDGGDGGDGGKDD